MASQHEDYELWWLNQTQACRKPSSATHPLALALKKQLDKADDADVEKGRTGTRGFQSMKALLRCRNLARLLIPLLRRFPQN